VTHRRIARFLSRPIESSVGAQLRRDDIGTIGLYRTQMRSRLATTREDSVDQTSLAVYGQTEYQWSPLLRTTAGLRADVFRFTAGPKNGLSAPPIGRAESHTNALASPKLSAVIGPWSGTELYVNAGSGFHSNDARSVLEHESTPLVRAVGAEVGLRTVRIPHVQSTISLWRLGLDSELVFIGDAGTTEAGRPSRRVGVEWATYASPRPWLSLDGDLAVSRATFTDSDPTGDHIPGSVESVVSLGASIHEVRRFSGSVRLRFFGPRPLTEDGSVRSHATSLLNAQASYRLGAHSRLVADLFNLLNETASDIDYFYTSRLMGEPLGGIADVHTHPALPRAARVALQVIF
jgi:outer membrane receptor protein involved in Fe transport